MMLSWAFTFLVIALFSALFGFAGIVGGAAVGMAKFVFAVSLVIAAVLFALSLLEGHEGRKMKL